MKTNEFDPLAYIENAFLDSSKEERAKEDRKDASELDVAIPSIRDYLQGPATGDKALAEVPVALRPTEVPTQSARFRKTKMSAPRPRRARSAQSASGIDPHLQEVWESLPRNIEFLCSFFDDKVTANYYGGEFKESRQELIQRLLDPQLTLEETSRLLGVCPATVRRYTNRGWLKHHRTGGGQRRFRLSDVASFVQEHGRFPQE